MMIYGWRAISDSGGGRIGLLTLLSCVAVFLCSAYRLGAQDYTDTLTVYFRQGRSAFDRTYHDNGVRASRFIEKINNIDNNRDYRILEVRYDIGCSPEGSTAINSRLASERANSVTRWLSSHVSFADSLVKVNVVSEDWPRLLELASDDALLPFRDDVIGTVSGIMDGRLTKQDLEKLGGGEPWKYMYSEYFPLLRRFLVTVRVGIEDNALLEKCSLSMPEEAVSMQPAFVPERSRLALPEFPEPEWKPSLYLKTNAIALGMLVANVAVEFELTEHLSVNIPVYYSGADWFSRTSKFRMLGVLPELRWRPVSDGGLFIGAHFGVSYYNFAAGGDWRIQDADGKSPAIGGGLGIGYRAEPFRNCPGLGLEFSLGCGVYSLKYDRFYNVPDGPLAEGGVSKTALLPDIVGVSVYYRFGGDRR